MLSHNLNKQRLIICTVIRKTELISNNRIVIYKLNTFCSTIVPYTCRKLGRLLRSSCLIVYHKIANHFVECILNRIE